jgi:predicted ATPase
MPFLKSLRLDGFLSFAPESESIGLTPLNVLIGPNGSGKSNFIEALELLHTTPSSFAGAIREGDGAQEWLWKGNGAEGVATLEALIHGAKNHPRIPDLRYRLGFTAVGPRTEIVDEVIEEIEKRKPDLPDVLFYYRYSSGRPVINKRDANRPSQKNRYLERHYLKPDESVLAQIKEPRLYPELAWLGDRFSRIQTFREWSFGRYSPLRQPQPGNQPNEELLPNALNLGLMLNQLEHTDRWRDFNSLLSRFLPRYERFSTLIQSNRVQFFLHERGLKPIPAMRLSDGTIRFMAILALLLSPTPPPLVCIEEPELGLHPDALSLLAELMVEASEHTQLVVTTHSDALVSAFTEQVDSVLVSDYLGGTVLRRVDSEKLSYWLERYRLGEIWRIGEIGGNP